MTDEPAAHRVAGFSFVPLPLPKGSDSLNSMKLKLHHINFSTTDVPGMNRFYRDILGLGDEDPKSLPPLNDETGVVGDVAFVTDGDIQMHLAERDVLSSFKTGQIVNPLNRANLLL